MEHADGNSPLSSSLSVLSSFTPESESPTPRLSLSLLQQITELHTLSDCSSLQVSLNANENAIDNIGDLIPSLQMLKLTDGSVIPSLRCLGSSLHALRYLYASQCSIEFLEGAGTMFQLQELYLAFNRISDLSPLSVLENLAILDIECNCVRDQTQITHLALCRSLTSLSMQGNPICQDLGNDYKTRILSWIPNLCTIEGEDVLSLQRVEDDNLCDKLVATNSVSNQSFHFPSPPSAAPSLARRPKTSSGTRRKVASFSLTSDSFSGLTQSVSAIPQRPKTASGSFSRPLSSMLMSGDGDTYLREMSFEERESTSELTHGLQSSLCGSLTQSLRAKRCKKKLSNPKLGYICEGAENYSFSHDDFDSPNKSEKFDSVLEDLQNWRLRFDTNTDLISDIDTAT